MRFSHGNLLPLCLLTQGGKHYQVADEVFKRLTLAGIAYPLWRLQPAQYQHTARDSQMSDMNSKAICSFTVVQGNAL